jgi:hypothetical protein
MKSFEIVRRGIYLTIKQHLPNIDERKAWELVDEIVAEAKSFEDLMPLTLRKIQEIRGD